MTAKGVGLYDCALPSVGNGKAIMGGLEVLPIACYGRLDLIFRSFENVVVILKNVARVPGLGLIFFLFAR